MAPIEFPYLVMPYGVRHHCLVPFAFDIFQLAGPVYGDFGLPDAEIGKGLAELRMEIHAVVSPSLAIAPTATLGRAIHPALDGVRINHTDILSGGCATHTAGKVYLDTRRTAFRKGEPQDAAVWRGRELRGDAIVSKESLIITGGGHLIGIQRSIPGTGVRRAGIGFHWAGGRHHQEVTQIATPTY